jgi:hypothetical protein
VSRAAILSFPQNLLALNSPVQVDPFIIFSSGDAVYVPGERRADVVEHVIIRGFDLYLKLQDRRDPVLAKGIVKVPANKGERVIDFYS